MSSASSVFALVLNWNRWQDTLECLASLRRQTYPHIHIVVVDNGSIDNSVDRIRQVYPDITLLENPTNLGFAGGANVGIQYVMEQRGDAVFLLNNDTIIAPDTVSIMVQQLDTYVGVVSPLIYYFDDPQMIWSAGGNLSPLNLEITDSLRGRQNQGTLTPVMERDFVPGTSMLIPRHTFEAVGAFDERFFMYYEDMDFCLRTRRAGLQILLTTEARVWHKVAVSSGGADSPQERYWMARSSVLYFRKHARNLQRITVVAWRFGSAIRTTARLIWKGRSEASRAYWRGLYDGLIQNR